MDLWQILAIVLGPSGAAWATIKVTLNGTAKRVERMETKLDDVRDRVTRLEARQS